MFRLRLWQRASTPARSGWLRLMPVKFFHFQSVRASSRLRSVCAPTNSVRLARPDRTESSYATRQHPLRTPLPPQTTTRMLDLTLAIFASAIINVSFTDTDLTDHHHFHRSPRIHAKCHRKHRPSQSASSASTQSLTVSQVSTRLIHTQRRTHAHFVDIHSRPQEHRPPCASSSPIQKASSGSTRPASISPSTTRCTSLPTAFRIQKCSRARASLAYPSTAFRLQAPTSAHPTAASRPHTRPAKLAVVCARGRRSASRPSRAAQRRHALGSR